MVDKFSVTTLLVVLIIGMSVWAWRRPDLMAKWIFNPSAINNGKQWWRFFTSSLIHSNYMHLGFNLIALHSFGKQIEYTFSHEELFGKAAPIYFLVLFFLGAVVADIPTYFKHKDNPGYNALGASGGVSSVVFAFILLFPFENLSIILIPFVPIPAWFLGTAYLGYSFYAARQGRGGINHSAHLWGSIFGIVFMIVMYPESINHLIRTITERFG